MVTSRCRCEVSTANRICLTIPSTPSLARAAYRPARVGEDFFTSASSTSFQIGRMTFRDGVSNANNPSNSLWGHFFAKKCGLKTTTPKSQDAKPSLILRSRLSPRRRTYLSYQTSYTCLRASARGSTKSFLSSDAWEMKSLIGSSPSCGCKQRCVWS